MLVRSTKEPLALRIQMAAQQKKNRKKSSILHSFAIFGQKAEDKSEEQQRRAQIVGDSLHIGYIGSTYIYIYI